MNLKMKYNPMSSLPKLAWLASLNLETFAELSVFHGSAVECRDTWMVEGVWDGDFSSGNFHTAENFFGSGIRAEHGRVYFVPSSALVDHLFYCVDRERLLVSNSLIALLGFTGAALDDKHDYYSESMSIVKEGIGKYNKEFKVIHPEIEQFYQVFYENIIVTKDKISFECKNGLHEITSYEQYYGLLWNALSYIGDNYKDPNRTIPISAFTTISSGYDSTAVTCLAKKLGVETCFTLRKSASWIRWSAKYAVDDGALAARQLNLNVIHADASPSDITDDELYFISTNYGKSQNNAVANEVVHSLVVAYIEQRCSAAVLFTGYRGDKVWDMNTLEEFLGEGLVQSTSEIGFSEIRLKSGFINIAVPYILARNIRNIVAISRSEEMKPWSLNNEYDRPIARRIAESSGVGRKAFGMQKKGVALHYYRLPKSYTLKKLFLQYLKKHYDLSPWFVYTNHALNQIAFIVQKAILRAFLPNFKHRQTTVFWPHLDIGFLMWIWAANLLSKKMGQVFHGYDKALPDARKKHLRNQAKEDQHTLLESQLSSNGHESRSMV
jgi:hypothetical protein